MNKIKKIAGQLRVAACFVAGQFKSLVVRPLMGKACAFKAKLDYTFDPERVKDQSNLNFWHQQLWYLLAAIVIFTRIPVRCQIPEWAMQTNRAARFLPVVGVLLGLISALSFSLFYAIWHSVWLALVLTTVVGIWLTGAFHEDGFADTCDGFGGSSTKERILSIMKDSRLGTYGVLGLGLLLTVKLSALFLFTPEQIPMVLILGYTLSRSFSASFIHSMNYVRNEEDSKFVGQSEPMSNSEALFVWVIGFAAVLVIILSFGYAERVMPPLMMMLLPLWALKSLLSRYWEKRIGGYTGDCLGGAQQLAEVMTYLALSAYSLNV
ncbi:adenosylcobinamide-GDP ribazoletransferase [Oceanospirillum sediminis]|uniref:Adenosylcobinamide-GDP ribazoletransferase n=1 Tax=Oceanospirillum sediminis TaxID=2760088 RepID=A0A839ILL4_9GAMM|nr:adenosylcobinamide-GDP ribazoletransferase [Oceanospirillum sediminis]